MMLFLLPSPLARGHDRGHVVLGCLEARARLAMPDPVDREIGREDKRTEANLERLLDHPVADAAVLEDVDLEPTRRPRSRLRDVPRRRRRDGRNTHERSCSGGALGSRELSLLVRDLM